MIITTRSEVAGTYRTYTLPKVKPEPFSQGAAEERGKELLRKDGIANLPSDLCCCSFHF